MITSLDRGNPATTDVQHLSGATADETSGQAGMAVVTRGMVWTEDATLAAPVATSLLQSQLAELVDGAASSGAGGPRLAQRSGPTPEYRIAGPGKETLVGTSGNDSLDGGGGNDYLAGAGGDDTLLGGSGNDFALGGAGNDLILGGTGHDQLLAGLYEGTDLGAGLNGGAGNDTIDGGNGDDLLNGDAGSDSLLGGAGNDTLDGGEGHDVVYGGDGIDHLTASFGRDSLYGDAGDDDILIDSAQSSRAEGGDGNDSLRAEGGAHTLVGGAGDDYQFLVWGTDDSSLSGGDGDDFLSSEYGQRVQIDAGAGNDRVLLAGNDLVVDLGAGDDWVELEGVYHWVGGGTGTITTGAGSDVIEPSLLGRVMGNQDAVVITDFTTGVGGDRLDVRTAFTTLREFGYDYSNPFTTGWMRFTQSGSDTLLQVDVDGAAGPYGWTTLSVMQNTTASSFTADNLLPGNLSPTPDFTPQVLVGGEQADTLLGRDGNDTLTGLGGNDLLDGGFAGDDNLAGGEGHDSLYGFTGNDTLDAGAGDDVAYGGTGDDLILGGDGNDNQFGSWYMGWYLGEGLDGGDGNDTIDGGNGDDVLNGGAGDDVLLGGAGNDTLTGSSGANVFSFDTTDGSDLVYGFSSGTDKLLISQAGLPVGDGDTAVEGATTTAGPGGFDASSELVVLSSEIIGDITAESAAAAIGSATTSYASGQTALFVVGNGTDSALYHFTSADADANVSAGELSLLATLDTAQIQTGDFLFGA